MLIGGSGLLMTEGTTENVVKGSYMRQFLKSMLEPQI
jgi:hypothetical protein